MNKILKGTKVRLQTTNGGDTETTLLEDYRPTYAGTFGTADGSYWFAVMADRIKSVTPIADAPADPFAEFYNADGSRKIYTPEEVTALINQPAPEALPAHWELFDPPHVKRIKVA